MPISAKIDIPGTISREFFGLKMDNKNIRNIAVIAHVDHGKTTLVDAMLKQSHVFRENQEEMGQTQIMDSNDLERERGITILAKNCAINYNDSKINIIDTPGHADFSGEVERTLGMADGALLIVDAQEGPMPQTRFVLKKALEMKLKIIVIINKIDKKLANPMQTVNKVESLFLEIADDDSQLEFPVIFAVGQNGTAFTQLPVDPDQSGNIKPILDKIIDYIPVAKRREGSFKMAISSLDYDSHTGRSVIGKIHQGEISQGNKVVLSSNPEKYYKIEKLSVYDGLGKVEVEKAASGEIIIISGVPDGKIGDTVTDPADTESLPQVSIGEPTIHITMGPNTSPFAGREGKFVTSRQIEERLDKELEKNLSLKVRKLGDGRFTVSGRGELHLSVLLETMRREGYEMEVGKPEVVIKEIEGKRCEPVEEVSVIVPSEYTGVITEEFGKRQGKMQNMTPINDVEVELIYIMPTRSLIGLRNMLLTMTKGTIIMNSTLFGFEPVGSELPQMRKGALTTSESGTALGYGLQNAQGRGITFIDPGTEVYEGMIIGLNSKDEDIALNVTKGKKLTNMRSSSSDGILKLTPATKYSLEQCLDFLEKDELLEITPENLRLRKRYLTELERKRHQKKN